MYVIGLVLVDFGHSVGVLQIITKLCRYVLFLVPAVVLLTSSAEIHYSTYDRELLAIYLSIRHFLEGRDFHVLTDHKPLTYAFASRPGKYSIHQPIHQ